MLDYSANYTAEDIATCVIPLGVRLEDDQRTADAIEGLDEYLTIKGTTIDAYHAQEADDFVYIQSAVNKFGWVRVVKSWNDVTVKENLKTKAEQWLTDAQYSKLELSLSAVDLALINNDIESFEVGDTVHAWAEPFNMDTTFPVRKKTIYLNDLSKNTIVLSNNKVSKSYTSQQSDAVAQLKNEIPQTYSVLEESQNRALAMLLSETQGGHIVYEYHYDSDNKPEYIEAINICNGTSIDQSTSRWRWSFNGLGFLKRNSTSDPWPTSSIPIALTNDGKIVAEQIGAGTINGCEMYWGGSDEQYHGHLYYHYLISDYPEVRIDADGHIRINAENNADMIAGNVVNMSGKYAYVGGRQSTHVGSSSGSLSLYGNSLDINGSSGATGSITWIDETQRKVFGLNVTKGIVTYINSTDY